MVDLRPSPDTVLDRLLQGNERYVHDEAIAPRRGIDRRWEVASAQHPQAMVISCSDSRAVPELIFDTGVGDLFVLRNAGHCVDETFLASVEFGVQALGIRLLLVLGHADCGAVKATISTRQTGQPPSGHLPALVAMIQPAIDEALHLQTPEDLLEEAVLHQHIRNSVERVRALPTWDPEDTPTVIGGCYDLHTGRVSLLARHQRSGITAVA